MADPSKFKSVSVPIETYKKLISLGLFKSVSMNFDTVENNLLEAKIDLIV